MTSQSRVVFIAVALVTALALHVPRAFAQVDMGCSGTVANPDCKAGTVRSSGTGSAGGSRVDSDAIEIATAARRAAALEAEGIELNDDAVFAFNDGDYAKSIALLEKAAAKAPGNSTIARNLSDARAALASEKSRTATATRNVQQGLQKLSLSLAGPPPASGLDFDGGTASAGPGASGLQFGDPRVVDARNVPSGLPKGLDAAIESAYGNAPPGIASRVRKGFQAVMLRDWKVADAWFKDALLRDPANAGLKRLIAAVNQPDRAGSSGRQPQPPALTQEELKFFTDELSKELERSFPGVMTPRKP